MIYSKEPITYKNVNKYDFEDDRFICSSEEEPHIIEILYIDSAKKVVNFTKFNLNNFKPYTDIQLIKNGFLLQHQYSIEIYEDKNENKIFDIIPIKSNNRQNNKYPLAIGLKDTIIYEDSNKIYFYYMKLKKNIHIKTLENIKGIKKINAELIVVFHSSSDFLNFRFYLINVPKNNLINIYNCPDINIKNEIPIFDKYIIKNINNWIELQDIFTSKKIHPIYYYGNNINDNLKIINHVLLNFSGHNLIYLYTLDK